MTGLGGTDAAFRTRDAMTRLIRRVIDQERPPYRYGTVTEINHDTRVAKVRLGSSEPVPVRFGALAPKSVGQAVRVGGTAGDLWIIDVLGIAILSGDPSANIAIPTGLELVSLGNALIGRWSPVSADKYQFQLADDLAITVNVRSFETTSTRFLVEDLNVGDTYYARVRALSGGSFGDWSPVVSGVPGGFDNVTDGLAPADSPAVACTPALGWIMAEWLPQPNNDLVTYEVHASSINGFFPDATTKLGETTSTHFPVNHLADGTKLSAIDPTFVRVIAKDIDGAAGAGPQGYATPRKLELGDVGNVPYSEFTDGQPPQSSPTDLKIVAGVGYLYLSWTHPSNPDHLTYEIHVHTSTTYTATAGTKVGETNSNFAFVRALPSVLGGGPLQYGTAYYVRIYAKDGDGYALDGASVPVQTSVPQVATPDVGSGVIVGDSIAALAIGTAHIQDLAVTDAKIGSLSADKITAGTIDASQINVTNLNASNITTGNLSANRIQSGTLDAALITVANLSAESIVSGTIDASVIGVTNLNASNITTGSMSASRITTGLLDASQVDVINLDATNITVGSLSGDRISGGTIIGTTVKTAASGVRVELSNMNEVRFYDSNGYYATATTSPGFSGSATGVRVATPGGSIYDFAEYMQMYASDAIINVGKSGGLNRVLFQLPGANLEIRRSYSDFRHLFVTNGVVGMKLLGGSLSAFQVRNSGDTGYSQIDCLVVNQHSSALAKERIEPTSSALSEVCDVEVKEWEYTTSGSSSRRHVGLIAEEAPARCQTRMGFNGEDLGIDLGSAIGLLWKAVQELNAEVKALQPAPPPEGPA